MQAFEALEIAKRLWGEEDFVHEPITPGCSGSAVVRVIGSRRDIVVRFWNMQWADYLDQDLACQLVASKAGYGPEVFFHDKERGITVMQYYPPIAAAQKDLQLFKLAELLQNIHKGPAVASGIDRKVYLDTSLDEAQENRYSIDIESLRKIKNEVLELTRKRARVTACHRDLHPGNLLYTGKEYLAIDYTWGAMDDPFADLANIAIFHCSSVEEEKFFLKSYFGREATMQEFAHFSLMKLPAKMFYGLEFLWLSGSEAQACPIAPHCYRNFGRHGYATTKTDFLAYSLSILDEVFTYAKSEEYIDNCKTWGH